MSAVNELWQGHQDPGHGDVTAIASEVGCTHCVAEDNPILFLCEDMETGSVTDFGNPNNKIPLSI